MEKILPKGWILSNIEDSIDILDNMRKPVSSDERAKRLGTIPYYGATGLAGYIDDYLFDEELILVGEDGAPFFDKLKNVAFKINGKSWVNNHAHVLRAKSVTTNDFLLHYLNQFNYNGFVGGTTRLKLTQGDLKKIPYPLPPLAEQERIVAKLDKLFAQHEKIKKALDRIPQLLKAFRQQVLTQAVTGKLTEQWREGKELEEWRTCELNSVLKEKGIFDGPFGSNLKTEDYTESGVRVVRLENIEQLVFLNNKKTYISLGKYELLKKHEVFEGDIIFSSFIADKIRACILPYTGEKMIAKADCFCLRPNYSLIEGQYMIYLLVSPPTFGDLARETRGATRPRINTTILKKLIISLPSLKEQQEIVRRVESLFAKADAIESRYQALKAKIDNLPQAILHKAFKGELVPQLPTDGDAKDLLAEIMALKKEVKGRKKK